MSTRRATLDALGFHNEANVVTKITDRAGKPFPYISYRAGSDQQRVSAGWVIRRPGFRTDPTNAVTLDHGNKVFHPYPDRNAAKADAIAWAAERYKIDEWVSIPGFRMTLFPGYVAREVERRVADHLSR